MNSNLSLDKGCDEVLTGDSGEISSPSSPWNGQKCETTIVAPPGKKIHLDFKSFDLPADAPWAPAHCFYPSDDNVEVRFDRYCFILTSGKKITEGTATNASVNIPLHALE